MNLRSVDLNLLVVLDALLDEAHVSRAAVRLNLSQPATSAALERCRRLFDDALLIRRKGGMTLTPKADRLHRRLKQVLAELHDLLAGRDEDLGSVRQTLRLSMSDAHIDDIGPMLQRHLVQVAPGIDLVFMPWVGPGAALEQLSKGEVDIAISQFPQVGPGIIRRDLGYEDYRVILRRNHPALARFDLDSWLEWPHLIVSGRGETHTGLDQVLRAMGRERRTAMVVPSFNLVFPLVRDTDLVAMVPRHAVPDDLAEAFELREPPVDMPGYTLHMAWHRRLEHDRVTSHVADFIARKIYGNAVSGYPESNPA